MPRPFDATCRDGCTIFARFTDPTLPPLLQALVVASQNFQHILRLLNTNVDGRVKIVFALTAIRGVGRRYATLVCKKADVEITKRAGEVTEAEIERIITIMQNPRQACVCVFAYPQQTLLENMGYESYQNRVI